MNQQNYVVGFLFDGDFKNVVLIQKQKPAWQAGLLNGIGGKVEEGEKPVDAMRREFDEEAIYPASEKLEWKHFCSMSGVNNDGSAFAVDFFFATGYPFSCWAKESEAISAFDVGEVCAGDWKTLGNAPWLVALARDFGKGIYPPTQVEVLYHPKIAAVNP